MANEQLDKKTTGENDNGDIRDGAFPHPFPPRRPPPRLPGCGASGDPKSCN